jgi:hypothetical protein
VRNSSLVFYLLVILFLFFLLNLLDLLRYPYIMVVYEEEGRELTHFVFVLQFVVG